MGSGCCWMCGDSCCVCSKRRCCIRIQYLVIALIFAGMGAGFAFLWAWLWQNNYSGTAAATSYIFIIMIIGCAGGACITGCSICGTEEPACGMGLPDDPLESAALIGKDPEMFVKTMN